MKYEDSNAPAWFIQAVNTPYQDKFIEVEGCKIHYQHWDNEGKNPDYSLFMAAVRILTGGTL